MTSATYRIQQVLLTIDTGYALKFDVLVEHVIFLPWSNCTDVKARGLYSELVKLLYAYASKRKQLEILSNLWAVARHFAVPSMTDDEFDSYFADAFDRDSAARAAELWCADSGIRSASGRPVGFACARRAAAEGWLDAVRAFIGAMVDIRTGWDPWWYNGDRLIEDIVGMLDRACCERRRRVLETIVGHCFDSGCNNVAPLLRRGLVDLAAQMALKTRRHGERVYGAVQGLLDEEADDEEADDEEADDDARIGLPRSRRKLPLLDSLQGLQFLRLMFPDVREREQAVLFTNALVEPLLYVAAGAVADGLFASPADVQAACRAIVAAACRYDRTGIPTGRHLWPALRLLTGACVGHQVDLPGGGVPGRVDIRSIDPRLVTEFNLYRATPVSANETDAPDDICFPSVYSYNGYDGEFLPSLSGCGFVGDTLVRITALFRSVGVTVVMSETQKMWLSARRRLICAAVRAVLRRLGRPEVSTVRVARDMVAPWI